MSDITNAVDSASRKQVYTQQRLLNGLRISESHIIANTSEQASLSEIDYKQSSTRGPFHVLDNFFQFFMKLYATTSKYLSHSQFDAHQDKAFTVCRENVFDDRELLSRWSTLVVVGSL